jgi:hypothetical protein
VLATDKEFLAWREVHSGLQAPRPALRRPQTRARLATADVSIDRAANEAGSAPAPTR